MEYFIKVLIVDDDDRYAKALQDRVYREYKILLVHYEDWDEAKKELFDNPNKYSYVILDALGKTNSDDPGDNPQHITKAIRDLSKSGKNIEYFILTAYFDEVVKFIPDDEKIFSKNKEENLLFSRIVEKFSSTGKMIVSRKFPVALSYVEDNFTDSQIRDFINLYHNLEVPRDETGIKNELAIIRVLNERNMDILGLCYEGFASVNDYVSHIQKTGIKISLGSRTIGILNYFSNNVKRIPGGIYSSSNAIYHSGSSSGSHSRSEEDEYVPSNNQLLSFKYGLIESIEWVGNLIESKTK